MGANLSWRTLNPKLLGLAAFLRQHRFFINVLLLGPFLVVVHLSVVIDILLLPLTDIATNKVLQPAIFLIIL